MLVHVLTNSTLSGPNSGHFVDKSNCHPVSVLLKKIIETLL